MGTVGIIANPSSGKDLRRLVSNARFVPNHEKIGVLQRVISGLYATRVEHLIVMPDKESLVSASIENPTPFKISYLDMPILGTEMDSTHAAKLMECLGVRCIVTLGGDGTNRAVVKGSSAIPMLPISNGTNNVFPTPVEGTMAGLVAGLVAQDLVNLDDVSRVKTLIEILIEGERADVALVDVAVSKVGYIGSRAIWDMDTLHEIFVAKGHPGTIGLSAISNLLEPNGAGKRGMHLKIGPGNIRMVAPVLPGKISTVQIENYNPLLFDKPVEITLRPGTVALDGERTLILPPKKKVEVVLRSNGPKVISVEETLKEAAVLGLFSDGTIQASIS